ncbi:hypothetical protein BDZ89DRAFT_1075652 [Hymenopellis radicata]|nr:hypothetical protein BDZ89DRAFT_1075652 [Hymenopellis radicata]
MGTLREPTPYRLPALISVDTFEWNESYALIIDHCSAAKTEYRTRIYCQLQRHIITQSPSVQNETEALYCKEGDCWTESLHPAGHISLVSGSVMSLWTPYHLEIQAESTFT